MTAIVAVIIAITSLIFNLVQWMSRHRPYLAIVDLSWSTVFEESVHGYGRIPDSIKCKIRNVGEAPAKSIHLKGSVVVHSLEKKDKYCSQNKNIQKL